MAQAEIARLLALEVDKYATKLIAELEASDMQRVWSPGPGDTNPAGTLAHHLNGNLRHYLGATFLDDGYVRDRPSEFADRDIPIATLVADLHGAVDVAKTALARVDDARAQAPYTADFGRSFDHLSEFLALLMTHFAYHTGQANYALRQTD